MPDPKLVRKIKLVFYGYWALLIGVGFVVGLAVPAKSLPARFAIGCAASLGLMIVLSLVLMVLRVTLAVRAIARGTETRPPGRPRG